MPAIVGVAQVNSISGGSVFHIGDVYRIAPTSLAKTFAGAGSFNTGDRLYIYNHQNVTKTNDSDFIDQANAFNV